MERLARMDDAGGERAGCRWEAARSKRPARPRSRSACVARARGGCGRQAEILRFRAIQMSDRWDPRCAARSSRSRGGPPTTPRTGAASSRGCGRDRHPGELVLRLRLRGVGRRELVGGSETDTRRPQPRRGPGPRVGGGWRASEHGVDGTPDAERHRDQPRVHAARQPRPSAQMCCGSTPVAAPPVWRAHSSVKALPSARVARIRAARRYASRTARHAASFAASSAPAAPTISPPQEAPPPGALRARPRERPLSSWRARCQPCPTPRRRGGSARARVAPTAGAALRRGEPNYRTRVGAALEGVLAADRSSR